HLEGERGGAAVEQLGAVEVGRVADPGELVREAAPLSLDVRPSRGVVGVVTRLDGQVTNALQDRVHLGQGTFRGLDDGNAILSVADGDLEATHLATQALADGKASSVVGS